jgi:biopolymer transport protein TolR
MPTRHRPMAEINVVPYIDVMLVLLVILMITAPLLSEGVKVDLPRAKAKTIATQKEPPLIITVDKKGEYYLNINKKPQQSLAARTLMVRVAAEHQIDPKRQVLVKGDRGVDYGKVITLMAMLQNTGIEQVGMLTDTPITQ